MGSRGLASARLGVYNLPFQAVPGCVHFNGLSARRYLPMPEAKKAEIWVVSVHGSLHFADI
jgi:hypothetical protein